MYQNFYLLKKEPFNITPDPEFLFLSPSHKEALAAIIYGVEQRKGFTVIVGQVGVGKTTIIRSYLQKVKKQHLIPIYIVNGNISFNGLLNTIYDQLGLDKQIDDVFEMINHLHRMLLLEYKQGKNVVLIIDEAQNMPNETFENLRTLSNLETSTHKLIQIVLVGQLELEQKLNQKELRPFKQRIALHSTIIPFTQEESMAYIKHRLAKVAIDDTPIFTKGAMKKIVKHAKGIPRTINILCDNALVTGFGYQKKPISSKIVNEVIADFEGKRDSILVHWRAITVAILLLMVGLFLSLPYKDPSSLKTENSDLPRPTKLIPIKKEIASTKHNPGIDWSIRLPLVREESDPIRHNHDISQIGQDEPTISGEKGPSVVKKTSETFKEEVIENALAPAQSLVDIFVDKSQKDTVILKLKTDGKVGHYNSFTLNKPARLTIDLLRIKRMFPQKVVAVDSPYLEKVRLGDHQKKVRVVLDFSAKTFPPYRIDRIGDELRIVLGVIGDR